MSFDLRKYAKETNIRLIAGFALILFLVGDGLIWVIYGRNAAILGFFCLLGGVTLLAMIWGTLQTLEWLAKNKDE